MKDNRTRSVESLRGRGEKCLKSGGKERDVMEMLVQINDILACVAARAMQLHTFEFSEETALTPLITIW